MKTKIFSLILLTTILLAMAVSAASFTVPETTLTFNEPTNSTTFRVEAVNISEPVNLSFTMPDIKYNDNTQIPFTSIAPVTNVTSVRMLSLTTSVDYSKLSMGEIYSGSLLIYETGNQPNNKTVTVKVVNGFCKYGEVGKLEITELEDNELDNEDAWVWHPFDDISFDVEVYNDFEDKEKVKIEYELYNSNGKKVDFGEDSNEQSVSIDDGDYEKVTFALKVPTDIDEDDDYYKLFIKAYIKSDESEGCIDNSNEFEPTIYYQEVRIEREEDRAVIIDKDKLEIPALVNCGDIVSISPKTYNIGIEEEDKVQVVLYNKELGIDLKETITNLDEGESATVDFSFKVPENVQEKTYIFNLLTMYEYDEDDDEYDSDSKSDLEEDFDFALKVKCVEEKQLSSVITAELVSEAVAGKPLTIKGTLKNTGDSETTYTLSITGYSSWASLDKIEPLSVTLKTGESKDFNIYLNVNEDVADEQFFTIKANYDGKSTEQEVSVLIEAKQGVSLTGAAITENIKKNWFIWVIVVINIILIVAIIAVARRIVKSR